MKGTAIKMRIPVAGTTFETEADTIKELFRIKAEIQQVFLAGSVCGKCNGVDIHCQVRGTEKGDYYEFICQTCGHTLGMGQTQAGGSLFPKRKDKDGNFLEHNGWRPPYTGGRPDPRDAEAPSASAKW